MIFALAAILFAAGVLNFYVQLHGWVMAMWRWLRDREDITH